MRTFIVMSALLAIACGRPEPPLSGGGGGGGGYNYVPPPPPPAPPGDSYGAPPPQQPQQPPLQAQPAPVYGAPVQPPTVHKHVYVHVPPPEPDYQPPRKPLTVAAPQKHYKIIFIKAPAPPVPTVPIIPVQPQNEEKTLVYVLVKKPEDAPEVNIPTPAPTQPSKPEVYFIRYKTQKQEGGYPDSGVPQNQYGPPQAPPSNDYGAPSHGGY